MNTEISRIDTNNYENMSKLMGMGADVGEKKQSSTLGRLKIQHSPIMGEVEVKGKKTQAALVNSGVYKFDDLASEKVYYADKVSIRPFIQRFMYKKYVKPEHENGYYIKTVMSVNLNLDLKDTMGGFNCGKPAGYIKDFDALPEPMKQKIKGIKRVRTVFGMLSLDSPVDSNGDAVKDYPKDVPFIWEIDNRDAFKIMGEPISKVGSWKHLPIQHNIKLETVERKLNNGSSFYLPTVDLVKDTVEIEDSDHALFDDFIQWIKNYNVWVFNEFSKKAEEADQEINGEDAQLVEQFVSVD